METATRKDMRNLTSSKLFNGDAMSPNDNDMLAQIITLPMGTQPRGDGWRVMTGNVNMNLWARVAYRDEAKADLA